MAGAKPGHKLTGVMSIKRRGHQAQVTSMISDFHCILQNSWGRWTQCEKLQLRHWEMVIAPNKAATSKQAITVKSTVTEQDSTVFLQSSFTGSAYDNGEAEQQTRVTEAILCRSGDLRQSPFSAMALPINRLTLFISAWNGQ